jgi:glycine/D-amino acid oxidase-like deaminating enzyme
LKTVRLEYANIVATHDFAAKHNIPCESRPCDTVDIIYDQSTFDSGVAAIEFLRTSLNSDEEAARYEIFDSSAAKTEFLTPGNDVVGAFKYIGGSISAYKFGCGVLKMCLQKGLNLQTYTPVEKIYKTQTDDGKPPIWVATTSRGEVRTPNLILATNGYSAHLLPQLQGKIVPIRGQVTAHRSGPELSKLCPAGLSTTYSFIYKTGYEYMIPRPYLPSTPAELSGDIVIGGGLGQLKDGGLSEYGETDDTVLNLDNSAYLRETTKTYFGSNWGQDDPKSRVRKEWSGIMGFTGDGLPFVGALPDQEGLWISAGFNGHGKLTPI